MDTSLVQTSLEELLTYQGEDAEAKESQNHHINKLLHRAQQGPNNDLQTWGGERPVWGQVPTHTHSRHTGGAGREQPGPQRSPDCRLESETGLAEDSDAMGSGSNSA